MSAAAPAAAAAEAAPLSLTFATWNVRGARSRPTPFDPAAVADAIVSLGIDVVALQEIGTADGRCHAESIAKLAGMEWCFGENVSHAGWRYGNAIVSRFPIVASENLPLPRFAGAEARGCLVARIAPAGGAELRVAASHFGLGAAERAAHARHVAEALRCGAEAPLVVGADANDWYPGADTRTLRARFRDAWRVKGEGGRATYPSAAPVFRLDHVYVGEGVDVVSCTRPSSPAIRSASDHLPVVARLSVAYWPLCSRAPVSSVSGS